MLRLQPLDTITSHLVSCGHTADLERVTANIGTIFINVLVLVLVDVKMGPQRNYHEGRAAIRHYANQPYSA